MKLMNYLGIVAALSSAFLTGCLNMTPPATTSRDLPAICVSPARAASPLTASD